MQQTSSSIPVWLVLAAMAAVAAPGCGSQIAGTFQQLCEAQCQSTAACNKYVGIASIDVEACKLDCKNNAAEFEDELMDTCAEGNDAAAVHEVQAGICRRVLGRLEQHCQDPDHSTDDFNSLQAERGTACYSADEPIFYCR